ncbi:MAG: helix-turn-helix domain-containing protein [Hyphomicrobiales bacterium]
MSRYIYKLIAEGEHQRQDFKFQISDSKKIARTLVAFANTDGGKLLIGVKDNGVVAGIRSAEEMYMIEAAGDMYCRPKVETTIKEWNIDGKMVLEVDVKRSNELHSAPSKEGKYMVFVRVKDQNIMANAVLVEARRKKNSKYGVSISYNETQQTLMSYLNDHEEITLNEFASLTSISRYKAKRILVDLLATNIIEIHLTENSATYSINKDYFSEE